MRSRNDHDNQMPADVVLLLSTFPSVDGARTATCTLVEERLVACGNIVQGVESIYAWKGEIESSLEVMVIFKTTAAQAGKMMQRLRELHPYEVPEMLQVSVDAGWPDYLSWVKENVSPK